MATEFIVDRHARSGSGALGFTITDPEIPITGYVFADLFLRGHDYTTPHAGVSLQFVDLQVKGCRLGQLTATVMFFSHEIEPAGAGVGFTSFGEPGVLVPELSRRVTDTPDPVPGLVEHLVTTLASRVLTDRRVAEFNYDTAEKQVAHAEYDYAQADASHRRAHETFQRARAARDTAFALWRHITKDNR